jgi:hypothetical protein
MGEIDLIKRALKASPMPHHIAKLIIAKVERQEELETELSKLRAENAIRSIKTRKPSEGK